MEFQFDPIGLGTTMEKLLLRFRPMSPRTPAGWTTSLWAQGKQAIQRRLVSVQRWQQIQRQEQVARMLDQIQRDLNSTGKPALGYVVPFDIGQLQSGGGKRIAGIAKALSAEFNVYIVSSVWSSTSCSMVRVAPNCHLLGLPAGPEFQEQNRIINAVPGAGIFAFPDYFNLLPEFHAVLSLLGDHARAWGFTSPSAWPVLRRYWRKEHPVFYDAHDDYSQFLQNSFACKEERLVNRMVDLECELLHHVTVAAFCTTGDLASARARCPACTGEMVRIPNGVDVETCVAVPPAQARENRKAVGLERPVAVFVGAHHKPNLDAADWIVRELAPVFPNVIFVVMGMHLVAYRKSGGAEPGENVVFTGPVSEEIKEVVFALADVGLAPMKSGTGSSLKIPDYIAHGKIVVGTPIGLRGGEELLAFESVVASEDVKGTLKKVLERLERDPESYTEPCRQAREWVAAHLDWTVAAKPLVDALDRAAGAR